MQSFANTSSPLGAEFKRLDPKDQSGIFFCLSLSAFLQHCIANDFVPIIEATVKTPCVGVQRKKIVSELAIAMLASCDIPNNKDFADLFGCDPELLRGITVMFVLADSDEPRKVLEKTSYARNGEEARIQAVSAVMGILEVSDQGLIGQLNGAAFAKKWNEFNTTLIPGILTEMKGWAHPAMIGAALQRIATLSPWSKAVLQEYINRITAEDSKSHDAK